MADLASLSRVRNYVQPDDAADDAVLADLVRFASGVIRTHVGRLLTTPAVTEQRSFYLTGRSTVRLDDKLSGVSAVSAGYPFERALLTTEFEIQQFVTCSQLTLARAVEGSVAVTGTWGWASGAVPADLEYATIVTVDEWYRGNVVPPTSTRGEGEAEGANIYLPEEVQQILAPWRPAMLIG